MPQTIFELDQGTAKAIEELKSVFGVTTSTAVIRSAVALARIASRNASQPDNTVTLIDAAGEPLKVILAG